MTLNPNEMIIQSSVGSDHSLMLSSQGRVIAWGRNDWGQLGDGSTFDSSRPKDITSSFNLQFDEQIIYISTGYLNSSALSSNGRVFTWGRNDHGQLGNNTLNSSTNPVDITHFFSLMVDEKIISLSNGSFHSAALTSRGRLFTWGRNDYGQVGNNTIINALKPINITPFFNLAEDEKIIVISLGWYHSSAVTSFGKVFSWGANFYGHLGDGTTNNSLTPVNITTSFDLNENEWITDISMGGYHSAALSSMGRVLVWGRNNFYQLGNEIDTNRLTPSDMTSLFDLDENEQVSKISLGGNHSSVLTSKGATFSWGANTFGQLGDHTTLNKSLPHKIDFYSTLEIDESITDITLHGDISSALTSKGRIFTWGSNVFGQLGDGTTVNKSTPTLIMINYSVIGHSEVYDFNEVIKLYEVPQRDGYLFSGWFTDLKYTKPYIDSNMPAHDRYLYGYWSLIKYEINYHLDGGINGQNPMIYHVQSPSFVLLNPTKIGYTFEGWYNNALFEGEKFSVLEKGSIGDLELYAKWSVNSYQLKYEVIQNDFDPISHIFLISGETITDVTLGRQHSFALTSTGRIFSWGSNIVGQLGDGTKVDRAIPTDITRMFDLGVDETIIQISLGGGYSAALTSRGRLFTWGGNYYGQLGDGTTIDRTTPTEITSKFGLSMGEKIIQVSNSWDSIGGGHSIALTSTGRIFTWGNNADGQLADNTSTYRLIPKDISNMFSLSGDDYVTQITLGSRHSALLTSTGRIFMWGYNYNGQLGDGTTIGKIVPTEITSRFSLNGNDKIIHISLGNRHSSALTSTGRMFTWGSNAYGRLGDGTTTTRTTPTEITGQFASVVGNRISSVSLGGNHSSAVTTDGRLFTWGSNNSGELGNGTKINTLVPTEITSSFDLEQEEIINDVELGEEHSSAVTSKGRIFTWGNNYYSQLGENSTIDQLIPQALVWKLLNNEQLKSYFYNSQIDLFTPSMSGYTFDGWFFDMDFTMPFNLTTMPDHDVTVYSKWNRNSYTIEFDYQTDGFEDEVLEKNVLYGTFYGELPKPSRSGYIFTGWLSDSMEIVDEKTAFNATHNRILYAQWSNTGLLYNRTSDGYEVSKGTVTAAEINIPAIYNGNFVTGIANYGFQNSSIGEVLTTIRIPFSVKRIGDKAFYNASNLENFMIDENSQLEYIGSESFMRTSMTSFTIPASVKTLGWSAFEYASLLESVIFEEGVQIEYLGLTLFRGTKITHLHLPASVNSISTIALIEMDYLQNITVDSNNLSYKSINGVLYNFELDTIISYPKGKVEEMFIVSDQVTQISSYAFAYNTNLKFIYIPSSVETIQSSVFVNSFNLTINVAVQEKPAGWDVNWNSLRVVNWGYSE